MSLKPKKNTHMSHGYSFSEAFFSLKKGNKSNPEPENRAHGMLGV